MKLYILISTLSGMFAWLFCWMAHVNYVLYYDFSWTWSGMSALFVLLNGNYKHPRKFVGQTNTHSNNVLKKRSYIKRVLWPEISPH